MGTECVCFVDLPEFRLNVYALLFNQIGTKCFILIDLKEWVTECVCLIDLPEFGLVLSSADKMSC